MEFLAVSTPAIVLGGAALVLTAVWLRRGERHATRRVLAERADARRRGSHQARLQQPFIDLDQCIGCGACVAACPEEGVLAMAHGQAVVVHGARCVGHARCAEVCPAGAVAVRLADISERRDLPAIDAGFAAVGVPGLYVAGELTGHALVRTAVRHGTAVADAVASTRTPVGAAPALVTAGAPRRDAAAEVAELLIVGAGPAGLACALRARERGLRAVLIDQAERAGGAVATYPREKLVMTQPMELPLHGRLGRLEYRKEELVALWDDLVVRHSLDFRPGVRLTDLRRTATGGFVAETTRGTYHAQRVCLALGRRGTPRRLGVPGEDAPQVRYALLDAASHRGEHVLVVGGGDSAIEAALALAAQPGNRVTLSYRKAAFFRLKARNERAIHEAAQRGRLELRLGTQVRRIEADRVVLAAADTGAPDVELPNDAVFVLAGGEPPFPLLQRAGVSFDPADRPPEPTTEPGRRGLVLALSLLAVFAAAVLLFVLRHDTYYAATAVVRARHADHDALRPIGSVGLAAGLAALGAMACNLAYLARRRRRLGRLLPGALRTWMNAHVLTGLGAFLAAGLHAGFAPQETVGGHAFAVFAVVVVTGAVGRWLYASLPRALNGAALDAEQLAARTALLSREWDEEGRGFGAALRAHVDACVSTSRAAWGRSLPARLLALLRDLRRFRRRLAGLRRRGLAEGVPAHEVDGLLDLARRSWRLQLAATHYDELRAALASWRYLHRWLALLLVTLTAVHVGAALRYAGVDWRVLLDLAAFARGGAR